MECLNVVWRGMVERRCAICGDVLEEHETGDVCWDCQNLMLASPVTNPAVKSAGGGVGKRPYI